MTHSDSFVSSQSPAMRIVLRTLAAVFFAAALISSGAPSARAQAGAPAFIHHKITTKTHQSPGGGRDFWFAMMSNYWGENTGGKYMRIYIASPQDCTAFVVSQGATTALPVKALTTTSFLIPEFWEMESSGVPENKAIHVYSNDGDLTVYDMSHNDYTSDGSYIIPTIGWGTQYVVAAYGSLFEGATGGYVFDLPSTMAVVADQDNTTVQITPSCDCRLCTSGSLAGNAQAATVAFPMGVTQTFTLNRGYSLQLMPVMCAGPEGFDMTGTIVSSNVPVGVEGGSVCPNITDDFPYCDHVEDMIPPVRTWAETYYTTSFAQPPQSVDDYGMYLAVSSQPNQTIFNHDCVTGDHELCVIPNQYGIYWVEKELGQKIWSSAPFMLVEYINSSTYPGGNNGSGDPAEVVINPREQFNDTLLFQTPISIGNKIPYFNYLNVIVNIKDANNIYLDRKKISGIPSQCIDNIWEIFTVTNVAPGPHTLVGSDSGVGAYIYGYGFDESYAWTGSYGTATFLSKDSIPPVADTIGHCYQSFVHVTDSGLLPDGVDSQSGLSEIRLDSVYNMAYELDPDWLDGRGVDSSGYGMFVVNPADSAILIVDVFDVDGNETTITSTYLPQVAEILPTTNNLGVYFPAGAPKIGYDTLINIGATPFIIDTMYLKYGNVGFTIDSAVDLSALDTGKLGRRLIKIQFIDPNNQRQVDSIIYGSVCGLKAVAVIGSGGAADFAVTSQVWSNKLLTSPPMCYLDSVQVENLSPNPLTIDSVSWPDKVHFHSVSTFPFTVPPSPASSSFLVEYCPDSAALTNPDRTQGIWFSPQVLAGGNPDPRFDSLVGNAISPSETFTADTVIVTDCSQQGDTIPITFTVSATGTSTTTIAHVYQSDPIHFFNDTGTLSSGVTWLPDTGAQKLQPGQSATITIHYIVPTATDTTLVDSLMVVDGNGDTIATLDGKTVMATVTSVYYAGSISPSTEQTFGPVQFEAPVGAPGTPPLTKPFNINNIANAPLIITSIGLQNGPYNPAFKITTVPPFPDTLQPGQNMLVNVTYDDSLFFDPVQIVEFSFNTNSCTLLSETDTAYVTHPTPITLPFTPTPILSCDTRTDSAKIVTYGGSNSTYDAYVALVSNPQWVGVNHGQNFTTTLTAPDTIHGNSNSILGTTTPMPITTFVPVTFSPTAVPGAGVQVYTDSLQIHFINSDGHDTTEDIAVTGIAGSVQVTAVSDIANTTASSTQVNTSNGVPGDVMSMPALVSVNIPSIPANVPLAASLAGNPLVTSDELQITSMELTYIIPQRDMLTFQGFKIDGKLSSIGWQDSSVKNTTTNTSGKADTIIYMLYGSTPLTSSQLSNKASSYGQFSFLVDVDQADNSTPVTLQTVQLYSGASPVGSCIGTSDSSGSMSLVLACGDQTLRNVMNGVPASFIGPATPDPVTGGDVTFKYMNRGTMTLSLTIYDALGNTVAQPVNNVYHDAGSWQVTADVSKLPSGTYTYRLSGNSADTGPLAISNQFVIQR